MKIKNFVRAAAATVVLAFGANVSQAALIGSVEGADSDVDIDLTFINSFLFGAPFANVLNLTLNGTTAAAGPIVWDSVFNLGGSASPSSISGVDTSVLSFNFSNGEFGWFLGDSFSFSVDPDFVGQPSSGLTVSQLTGVGVYARYSNGASLNGAFVDDPRRGEGLKLVAVPEPATLGLLGVGLLALGATRRKKI